MNRKIVFVMFALLLAGRLAVTVDVHKVEANTVHSFYLYGNYLGGWGFTAGSITNPGPTITVDLGDVVNVTLVSTDGIKHKFFVDYNGNDSPDASEPASPDFTGTVNYQFTADRNGTFTYLCAYHTFSMRGTFVVNQTIPEFPSLAILSLFTTATLLVVIACRKRHTRVASRK
jgi:FtsP/CotA-like multicopper oxidase with cupredoxin domain